MFNPPASYPEYTRREFTVVGMTSILVATFSFLMNKIGYLTKTLRNMFHVKPQLQNGVNITSVRGLRVRNSLRCMYR